MFSARPNLNREIVVGSIPLVLGLLASIVFPSHSKSMAAIKVNGMCCACSVKPVLRQLRGIQGVTDVHVNATSREIYVYWKSDASVEPDELWRRTQHGRLQPAQLTMGQRIITCDKPTSSDMSISVLP